MLRKSLRTLLMVLPFAILATSCGGGKSEVSRHVRDRKAYSLGQEHAATVVSLRADESSLQDALLDIRARQTNIRTRIGAQAAVDYERGFVDYITERDDSLARILF